MYNAHLLKLTIECVCVSSPPLSAISAGPKACVSWYDWLLGYDRHAYNRWHWVFIFEWRPTYKLRLQVSHSTVAIRALIIRPSYGMGHIGRLERCGCMCGFLRVHSLRIFAPIFNLLLSLQKIFCLGIPHLVIWSSDLGVTIDCDLWLY